MDETQTLAVRALRELLDDPDRNDWDELVAANRALIKAIKTGEPMPRRNARIVAEYLREADLFAPVEFLRGVSIDPQQDRRGWC
jgi:hypothetical protein